MIKFIKSPTAIFKLAYFPGDEVSLTKEREKELIDKGYAVEVKKQVKKAVKKTKK